MPLQSKLAVGLCIRFYTSTPLDVVRGSGTFAGIATLARSLESLGVTIELVAPRRHFPVYTLERLWFNERLRRSEPARGCDLAVGFDLDGYRIAARPRVPHIASIKGVIADEMRFERGFTRATMAVQAACERQHVQRAAAVMTTSQYAAGRLRELYGITNVRIVPELIDLAAWRALFSRNPAEPDPKRFTVLSVGRFYRRKRLELLLGAAARLRERIPELQVRIAGGGPEAPKLQRLWRARKLERTVVWLGDVSQNELAREYQRADVFCSPSVQEGFGIVFLEAMAAGKPIVAARAAAVPEVVPQGLLVEPESDAALADAIARLHADPALRRSLAETGGEIVARYDAPRIARLFLDEAQTLVRAAG